MFHAHVHVIPRFENDGVLQLPAGKDMIEKDAALALLSKIHAQLQ